MSAGKSSDSSGDEDAFPDLETVIREILARHKYLHEFRLQKLVYLVDLIYKLNNGDRLTDADFKPYSYGAFSQDVRDTLEEIEPNIPSEPDWQHGKSTTRYLGGNDPDVDDQEIRSEDSSCPDDDVEEVIDVVRDMTGEISSEDLGDWSKESWLYKNTEYDEEMNFSRLDEVGENIENNIIEKFPESKKVIEDDP